MLTGVSPLTETFYDSYSWITERGITAIDADYSNLHDSYFYNSNVGDNSGFPYQQQNIKDSRTKGMITGTRTNVLGTTTYITTLTIYDDQARPIQVKTVNATAGVDITTTQYSWSGQPLTVVSRQEKADAGAIPITRVNRYTYDALGRVTQITQNTIEHNSSIQSGDIVLAQNQYDALGQLATKKLGINNGTPIESQHYDYNIRGWLLGVNRGYLNGSSTGHNFGFDLAYDKQDNLSGTTNYARALYNGNIAGMSWKGKTGLAELRRYDYDYDAANRLLKGDFTDFTSPGNSTGYDIKMGDGVTASSAYDLNGNILKMWQRGLVSGTGQVIDDLTYVYQGSSNKLARVTDAAAATTGLGDFNNGSNGDDDYAYDVNGNLTLDKNKNISSIIYNILNLPEVITVTGKGTIAYLYDASGVKLSKIVNEPGVGQTTTQYLGGLIFENNVLQHVSTAEGRARLESGAWKYDYFLKDYLGDVRMMLADNGAVLEEMHYYPFGLTQRGISTSNPTYSLQNKYKFNGGNELQTGEFSGDVGLELYDAVNRLYDPQLGRFWQVDEFGEANEEWTTFNFAINNPISFNDPFGLKEGPKHVKELENVMVLGVSGGLWGKTNFYYQALRNGVNIDMISNNSMRKSMQNIRRIVNDRERRNIATRESDEIVLEIAVTFAPVSQLLKLRYLRYAARLFNFKRGKVVVKVAEETVEHIDEVAVVAKEEYS
ncbi:RHS repeat domain-containing protein [Niabella hibiscisoli]|uniref:RHS repeat domain-containing protein n=1 Tax=Niabella hibiscisoli TaxID=1825928 RepID=UPI001F0E4316|nr:RHS repeat-associated core domain-containing protein [Niabella hibiscisoli]MCH5718259.1 hypothetical protein [Niabella hibiscisoli]